MEFLVSYFPLETTAHRNGDLEPKQQVQWAVQREMLKLAEMQMQNLRRECRTQTGSADCFYSCILASGCVVQGSLFSRLLNCMSKYSGGHEPWEPAMNTLEMKGRRSLEQVASRSWSLRDALGPGWQRNDFQLPMRCPGRHRESLPCFLWHQEFDCPAAGKAQTSVLSSLQDEIPNLSAKRSSDVSKEDILCVHTEMTSLIFKEACLALLLFYISPFIW